MGIEPPKTTEEYARFLSTMIISSLQTHFAFHAAGAVVILDMKDKGLDKQDAMEQYVKILTMAFEISAKTLYETAQEELGIRREQ